MRGNNGLRGRLTGKINRTKVADCLGRRGGGDCGGRGMLNSKSKEV